MELSITNVLNAYLNKGYKLFAAHDHDLNIFGVRFFDNQDQWTDIRGVLYKLNGNWILWTCPCTTKPSTFALKNPENAEGTSTLKEGQYLSLWESGYHKNVVMPSHRALVQKPGTSLPVYRDIQKDGIIHYDESQLKNDGAGINLHGVYNYPPATAPPSVYNWSYGCNVISKESDQMTFMDLVDTSAKLYGNSFSYTLFSHLDLAL
jgi:hypothetical protein